jgi:hypothetical protein
MAGCENLSLQYGRRHFDRPIAGDQSGDCGLLALKKGTPHEAC